MVLAEVVGGEMREWEESEWELVGGGRVHYELLVSNFLVVVMVM
jgi:hypothetical protein